MPLVSISTAAPHVRVVTLDNPDRLNSLSFALVADLYEALATVAADNDCRVVVLTGAGRAFCSGLELEHAGMPPGTEDLGRHRMGLRAMEYMGGIVPALRNLPQPVIAAIRGPAYGGGMCLTLGTDIRLAGRSAVFCGAGITNGLTGCELERIGLMSLVVDDDQLVDRAVAMAVGMCALSPLGLTLTKDTLWGSLEVGSLQTAVDLENRTQLLAGHTGNLTEATAAFKEKRPPVYTE